MSDNLQRSLPVFVILSAMACAQVPPAVPLSDRDRPLFEAELARVDSLLRSAPDRLTAAYVMARTCASAKQWPEALEWLRKVVELKAGFDPSRDPMFAPLQGTAEFASILQAVRDATAPITHSTRAFEIPEGDLAPESLAYDPHRKQFYFGSLRKKKIVRCSISGECADFADGLGIVVGLKIRDDGLWALNNSEQEGALLHYDLAKGTVLGKYAIAGAGHMFNDLAFTSEGDVYLTDTSAGAVWHLAPGGSRLTVLGHTFESANGIALSPDDRFLFVSTFGDGISVMDLKTRKVVAMAHLADLCLGMIDGLYFSHGSLIAIQNGFMSPRVVRMTLSRDLHAIEKFEVLERRNPAFEGITTGVLVGRDFYYMANIQDDKKSEFKPIVILKTRG